MITGEVQKGLDIVSTCRDRYDGRIRNPFDEYECGHWYARALSSYGLLQGLTGIRYDAVGFTYPTSMQMGWMEFFNPKANVGLYFANHDPGRVIGDFRRLDPIGARGQRQH